MKQNLTSAVSADRLIERYSQGDALVDAAIEAYAADRDVNEFLDTLHILANHSKEELEDMMRQSDADGDSQCEYNGFELCILWLNIDCFFFIYLFSQ